MDKSDDCPQCRKPVIAVKKNPQVNELIKQYLDAHPELKLQQSEYDEMEKKNKINLDLVKIKNRGRSKNLSFRDLARANPQLQAQQTNDCPECRNSRLIIHNLNLGQGDNFLCRRNQPHFVCYNCGRNFPDRADPSLKQRCTICKIPYCNLYLSCSGMRQARLQEFKDHAPPNDFNSSLLRNNDFETKILKDYLLDKGKSAIDIFNSMKTDHIDKGTFTYRIHRGVTPNTMSFNCL